MQHRLQRELAARWPEYALLGEEMAVDEQQRLLASPGRALWCLDPLDGTSNFAAGIPFFAVSLALIVDGATQAAVVYDPARDECFSALHGQGAWLNDRRLSTPESPATLAECMAMVDLKRLPAMLVRSLAERPPYRSQRSFGSVALDWCWVACGRCQVYLHGGQKLWDYAAGQLVLAESGAVGGLLDDYRGEWLSGLSLSPRIAMAATDEQLLAQWPGRLNRLSGFEVLGEQIQPVLHRHPIGLTEVHQASDVSGNDKVGMIDLQRVQLAFTQPV
jgi:myo-inositol-1(or 4)-monophosphatase